MFSDRSERLIAVMAFVFVGLAVAAPAPIENRLQLNPIPINNTANGPLASEGFSGDMTWFETGLGACGWQNRAEDHICAISRIVFDRTRVDGNPNHNPICGRKIHLQRGDRGIDVVVADRCEGCREDDIDVTRGGFQSLGNLDEGRVRIDWWWI